MSRRQKRARLPGEGEAEYQSRLLKIRQAEAETKRAKRDRRPDESESEHRARLAMLRQSEADARRERRALSRHEGDGRTKAGQRAPTDGQKSVRLDGHLSVQSPTGRTHEMSVRSEAETCEITEVFANVRPVGVRPVGRADVLPPSEGGGAGRTSAPEACPSSPLSLQSPVPPVPCPSSPEGENSHEPHPTAEESDTRHNVIALFGDKRVAASSQDRQESGGLLWQYVVVLGQRLEAAESALEETRSAVRALQDAMVWLRSGARPTPVPNVPPDEPAVDPVACVGSEGTGTFETLDSETRADVCAVWLYLATRHLHAHKWREAEPLSDLDVIALEQVWSQSSEAALGNRPRAEDLFYVWVERFLLDPGVPTTEKNPRGLCVRSHLFPRRLSEGLCEKWPPIAGEDDYLQCFPFRALRVEWEQLVSAGPGGSLVAAR